MEGRDDQAQSLYRDALRLAWELGNTRIVALCLEGLAGVLRLQAQPEHAAHLFGAAEALRDSIAAVVFDRADYDGSLLALHRALGDAGFAAAWARGRAMPLAQAVETALACNETP